MTYDQDELRRLVENPSETLAVELKNWIDPKKPEDVAKIAKGCMALYNHNGGFLVIGFDDKTRQPDLTNVPGDVQIRYHPDTMQEIVSRYASKPIEVETRFVDRRGVFFPVLCVPSGVKTPVAAKRTLARPKGGKPLITEHRVYVRSLMANNTPSTTEARHWDWENVVRICLENHEADIGRFLRRHLEGLDLGPLADVLRKITPTNSKNAVDTEALEQWLNIGLEANNAAKMETPSEIPPHGAFEAAFIISGEVPEHSANKDFLNLMCSSNPGLTGWPLWIDSRYHRKTEHRPRRRANGWEATLVSLGELWFDHIDFWRIEPSGRFYHRRALEDDIDRGGRVPIRMKEFDHNIPIWRVTEAIAIGLSFSRAMGCDPAQTTLDFGFRWTELEGRTLTCWSKPIENVASDEVSSEEHVFSTVRIPMETATSAIHQYVDRATRLLYEAFDGFRMDPKAIERIAKEVLRRERR